MSGANTWLVVKQALLILQHLQAKSADKETLMASVRREVPDAYSQATAKGRSSSFERDLRNLRERLYVDIQWAPRERVYRLVDPGPLFRLSLADSAMEGLAFLLETFEPTEGEGGEVVVPFIEQVLAQLSDDQQRRLQRQNATLRMDLRRLDRGEIAPKVWEEVRYAVAHRRLLRFSYLAPRHEKPEPRTHKIEPYELRFHRGHYEVLGYCLNWSNPYGYEKAHAGWFRYRLDRIVPEGLEVMPDILPPGQRQRRLLTICYRISPTLARGGISRHFEEMATSEPDENGWVTVTGKTTDLFEAKRILLAYGQHCVVLSPSSLRDDVREAVSNAAKLYSLEE